MKTNFTPADFVDVIQKKISPPNCDLTLQIEPTLAHDGFATALWVIDEKYINGHGVVMGGFLSAATDTIMAYALSSVLRSNQSFASIDLHTTFHRPLLPGTAQLEAKVERKGKSVAYLTAEVFQNGKKCCSSVSSIMIIEK